MHFLLCVCVCCSTRLRVCASSLHARPPFTHSLHLTPSHAHLLTHSLTSCLLCGADAHGCVHAHMLMCICTCVCVHVFRPATIGDAMEAVDATHICRVCRV